MNRCRGVINRAYWEISCLHKRKKIRESFSGFLCHKLYKRPFNKSLVLLDLTTILIYCVIVLGGKKHQHLQIQMVLRFSKQAKDSHGSSCLMRARGDY